MLTKSIQSAAEFMGQKGTALALISALVIGSALGMLFPSFGESVSGQIDFTILLLVFCLLFDVRLQDIAASITRPVFILVALAANFVIVPAIGFAISSTFLSAHPLFFIGLTIYFMAPCTDWFLGFTRLAKGNTSLGATLLPINMIVQLLLYPFYLQLFGIQGSVAVSQNVFEVLWQWFLVPLALALAARFVADRFLSEARSALVQDVVSLAVPFLLALLVGQIAAANITTLADNLAVFPLMFAGIVMFFAANFLLSEVLSRVFRFSYEDHVLLTMTTAARNAPLMLAITMAVIPGQPVIYAAIIIGMLIELPHLILLKTVLLRRQKSEDRADVAYSEEPIPS
ncbi:MAG: arsenic resistance protein [Pseudomonadota bacterium]